MIPAEEAIERLREGNHRFMSGEGGQVAVNDAARRTELAAGQAPFAVVLGCSDSRVPVEVVFDQGPGELFVVRVAGNVAAAAAVGSIEFAVEKLGTRLVVVLGHTGCGAVAATLDELRQPAADQSRHLRSIIDRIRPAVAGLLTTELRDDPAALVQEAVRANIRAAVDAVQDESDVVKRFVGTSGLVVVGAEYSLETGRVEFLG